MSIQLCPNLSSVPLSLLLPETQKVRHLWHILFLQQIRRERIAHGFLFLLQQGMRPVLERTLISLLKIFFVLVLYLGNQSFSSFLNLSILEYRWCLDCLGLKSLCERILDWICPFFTGSLEWLCLLIL